MAGGRDHVPLHSREVQDDVQMLRRAVTTESRVQNGIVCDVNAVTQNWVELSHAAFPIRQVEVARAEAWVVGADLEQVLVERSKRFARVRF